MDHLYLDRCSVRVLAAPVGRIKRKTFHDAVNDLQVAAAAVPLSALTPDANLVQRAEFAGPTFPAGVLRLDVVTEHDDENAILDEFHASRAVLVVVGILHGEEHAASDASVAECVATFQNNIVPKFPGALVHRCIALAPPPNGGALPDAVRLVPLGDHQELVLLVHDMATQLLVEFQDMASAIEVRSVIHSPPPLALAFDGVPTNADLTLGNGSAPATLMPASPAGMPVFQPTSASLLVTQEARLKKRAPGRAAKLVADLLFLAGKLPAAIDKYLEAMDAAKTTTDLLWLASAMEGLYAAMLALREVLPGAAAKLESLPPAVKEWLKVADVVNVEAKFRDIIAHYDRAEAPLLSAELGLRLAAMMADLNRPSLDAAALVTAAVAHVGAAGVRTQLALYVRAAGQFAQLGYPRKQALALVLAVRVLVAIVTTAAVTHVAPSTQFQLMEKLAFLYGLLAQEPLGWDVLQTVVLDLCVQLAEAVDDAASLTVLMVKCFQKLQRMLSVDGMLDMVARLQRSAKAAHPLEGAKPMRQFAFLKKLELVPPPPSLLPHKQPAQPTSAAAKDPFLYSAFTKKTSGPVHLAAGEPVTFRCHLVNPFSFAVQLESMVLIVDPSKSVAIEPEPRTVILPAHGGQRVDLRATPTTAGTLHILGCEFRIFGVVEQCTLASGVPAAQPRIKQTAVEILRSPAAAPTAEIGDKLEWTVVDAMPVVRVRAVGAAHKCLTLLEGQQTQLTLQLQNVGTLPVTALDVRFVEDRAPDTGLDEADAAAVHRADRYDLDHGVLAVADGAGVVDLEKPIAPGSLFDVPLVAFGKAGTTRVTVHVAYGAASSPFRRRLATALDVTVALGVAVVGVDATLAPDAANVALLHVDVRNAHGATVEVKWSGGEMVEVAPHATARCVVRVPRCAWNEAELGKQIPALKAKQFVLTKHGQVRADWRERTMCFWLKEHVLEHVQATWESKDGHHGVLDLGALEFSPEHVPVLWQQSLDVTLAAVHCAPATPHVQVVTLTAHNRADAPQSMLLQVMPDARFRVLGNPVVTLAQIPPNGARDVQVHFLGAAVEPWTLLAHVTRVAAESQLRLARLVEFQVAVPAAS
ncbi:hypothetical protein AMAG_13178 [Allomyces macrogynus ATCC 38327]|uniref:Uncharacterized protein n=1 Tax=Allomyces macrogynus (strain ATCC 38327) TaxID=578462 RepID=A0A0L0SZP7_ALLM3|nr:hypothetical protein AMAG_13178 [Allomyces macrogynus ATCC 38327]|eukprot:KNE68003.1 hypothetical protein AMAG_13178 [Allomyces macrogynus ATCC 38327]